MPSIRRFPLACLMLLPFAGTALAQDPTCEPDKLAEKYPDLVGETITIGADPQTPPYVMRAADDFDKIIGFDADLARAVLDCAGAEYEFFLGGWSGLLPATASGQVDIFWDNLYYTPERAKQVDYVLYMQAGTGGLAASGNPKGFASIADTCGATVAYGLGTVEEAVVQKQSEACVADGKEAITTMTYPDVASGTRLIQSGRADVMLTDLALVESFAVDNPDKYASAFKIFSGLNIGAAVRNDNSDLLQAIYDGLAVMQADGTQTALFQKYKIDPDMVVTAEIKVD
ncbi:MAG: ABC transporter substrate-binding protein [Acuticoccus sp.]